MKKKDILVYEVITPIVWFFSIIIWKYFIRQLPILEVINDATRLTLMLYVIFNLLIYFRYNHFLKNIKDKKNNV